MKAHFAESSGKSPPHTHNLIMLLKLVPSVENIPCDEEFLRELNAYYIESRYLTKMIYLTEIHAEINVGEVYEKARETVQ